ncbi:TNF receptor-associated factor homolog 1a-like [Bidens hawaiensis]|uniref:TNF receptor-associated factor homolog 1a-like n=1 Tax=Bidens hawaiensis TaxID=980011 RepID=UPI004049AA3E
MAGTSSHESKASRSLEGITKGVASMLPPSFNTEDDDCGLEPSQLYREFTWMITNYSKINKIEVTSNSFEVGGYKWERVDRPFRCLASEYKRELARIYISSVEDICNKYVKETRGKLEELIQDKVRWLSFCKYWLGLDQKSRNRLARVKSDVVLEAFVKHFFTEKVSTSALMMDSLYSELKTLKRQTKSEKTEAKCDVEVPVIQMESDSFILVDDLLPLLERTVLEPLPLDDENRTKDSVEDKERRLAELGRRIIELSVLAYMSRHSDRDGGSNNLILVSTP